MDLCVLLMMASALLVHGIVPTPSRCTVNGTTITCAHNSIKMPEADRMVYWQTPLSVPPPNGYPVAIFFQGSFFGPETTWKAHQGMIFGAWYQTHVVKSLLDAGFVVITPAAPDDLFWQTNIPPWDVHWANCSDDRFMREIFAAIETSQLFGHCDPSSMFATGISSGGYMTSRVAVEYPERWRAVVIESGSYMICGGPVCAVPGVTECVNDGLPFNHPPTLFLHGLIGLLLFFFFLLCIWR